MTGGWFGGGGPQGTGQMMESAGLEPGRAQALVAGATEAGSGLLVAAGAATPLAASGLTGVMLTAIRRVHWRNGPWNSDGGYEYNALILAALAGLVETGPGRWSLDAATGRVRRGSGWTLAALGLGALGSELALRVGRRMAEREASARREEPDEERALRMAA